MLVYNNVKSNVEHAGGRWWWGRRCVQSCKRVSNSIMFSNGVNVCRLHCLPIFNHIWPNTVSRVHTGVVSHAGIPTMGLDCQTPEGLSFTLLWVLHGRQNTGMRGKLAV